MPDRPAEQNFITKINAALEELRAVARQRPPTEGIDNPLQGFEDGKPLGDVRFLNFGTGIQAALIGADFVEISAASGLEWDAIVDSTLVASDPVNRHFIDIGEALTYLNSISLGRAFVLVRPGTYTETGNITAPAEVHLQAAVYPTGLADAGASGVNWVTTWDHGGFTMTATQWNIQGFVIDGGGAKTTLFNGKAYLRDCRLEKTGMTASAGRSLVSSGWAILYRCMMVNGWLAHTASYDSYFRIFTGGTYAPAQFTGSSGLFIMSNAQLEVTFSGGGVCTWNVPEDTYIEYKKAFTLGSGVNDWTISTPTASGQLTVKNDGNQGPRITVAGGSIACNLEGAFSITSIAAPGGGGGLGGIHRLQGHWTSTSLDLTGPALVDFQVEGSCTLRGTQIIGQIFTNRNGQSSGECLTFVNADHCNIQVVGRVSPTGSGTFKPYSFDAASINNVLIWNRHNIYPSPGTDAGTNNRVIPEGAAPFTTDGHVIEDEGTPLTQRANLNFVGAGVTVTDSAPDTVVTIPGSSGTPASTVEDETTFGITPAVGTDTEYARQDHTHGSPTLDWAETGDITTIDPDDAASGGVLDEIARGDHQHAIAAATAGVIEPDDAAAEGVATSFARSDHKHGIVAATPGTAAFGDTPAEGVATSFARSDHEHGMPAAPSLSTYLDRTFTDVTKASTSVLETLYSFSVPAADFASKGIEFHAWGTYFNNSGASRTLFLRLELGTFSLDGLTEVMGVAAAVTRRWALHGYIWVPGGSSSEAPEGYLEGDITPTSGSTFFNPNSGGSPMRLIGLPGGPAIDATAAQTLALKSQHSASHASLSITLQGAILKNA